MCTTGINTGHFRQVLKQQLELAKLLEKNLTEWSNLAGAGDEESLIKEIRTASKKTAELIGCLKAALTKIDDIDGHHHATITTL